MSSAFRSGAASPITNEVLYKDLGLTFTAHPITKNVKVLKNDEAVKRAVKNLILTNKYERPYNPLYGGNITSYLFENFTPGTQLEMERQIETAIEIYEPRAILLDVNVRDSEVDNNRITVTVFFRVANQTEPTELSFTVERTR